MTTEPGRKIPETVEAFGVEIGLAMGWPPMAGRVLATLMLHEGPMSMKELQEALSASAGAVSESARMLDFSRVVTRVKMPGGRQIGYVYRRNAWLGCLQHQVATTVRLLEVAESSSRSPELSSATTRQRFEDMRTYYDFLARTLKTAEQEFKERHYPSEGEGGTFGNEVDGVNPRMGL